jgi:hypothetical protein
MIGDRLAAIGRAVTTTDTFELMVSPSIADLQRERSSTGAPSWRAYAAVWRTLAAAIVEDVGADARATLDRETVRRMLNVTAWTLLLLVVAPRLWALAEIGLARRAEMVFSITSLPSAMASVLPVLMLPLAAVVAGRGHGRTVLLMAGGTALIVLVLDAVVIPTVQRAWTGPAIRQVLGSDVNGIRGKLAVRETVEDYVFSGITGQPFGPVFLDEPYSERQHVSRVRRTAAIVGALAFALCGSALRVRRAWAIVAVTLPAYLFWVWLSVFTLVWMSGLGFHPAFRAWLPTLTVLALGMVAMTLRCALDRRHLRLAAQ